MPAPLTPVPTSDTWPDGATALAPMAERLVAWQRQHGRHDLPWQGTRDPYRVWLSEVMLQQTQVSTVMGYYARFLARFPDVAALAAASQDEVLGLWSGLGYYSRARMMHRCAQAVCAEHGGQFPRTAEALVTLPGIGPSTAAAVASFCFGERISIMDGNVRRVLSRWLAWPHDLAQPRHERALWAQAQALLPTQAQDMPAYTQGLMDLGATLCTTRAPACQACPLQADCQGRAQGEPTQWPIRTRKLKRLSVSLWLLWAEDAQGRVWLHKRPQQGIWAGLHAVPVFETEPDWATLWPQGRVQAMLPVQRHALTHRELYLHWVRVQGPSETPPQHEGQWCSRADWAALGLPKPVRERLDATGANERHADLFD